MDPLTAFSLACGVIQVVDFSIKVLAKCKEIYDHGAITEHQDVEDITKHLTDLRIDAGHHHNPGTTQTPDDKELRELVKTCSATAEQLVAKLQTLKTEGPHKKRQAIIKTVKALRERKELHDIEKRLNNYRNVLNTKILVNLRQRSDLASLQQSHDFHTLDQGIQRLVTNLSEGPKSFEELRIVTRKENEETREHISKALQQQKKEHEEKEFREGLLNSLWFDEIYSREENIVDAHRKTFEWIFDVSDHAMGPWHNFIQWLENGQGTYWMNGKAGSGKSTLMSFLCQDDRTLESLRRWSGIRSKNVLMPKFYFWSSGNQMQKSIEGLLRSLIWQVLQSLPDLDITSSAFDSRNAIPAWTERRLQTTLRSILQQSSRSHLVCLFIDGLDEYEGDQGDLIKFIEDLVQRNTIKVCLSSRTYREFDQAFGRSARLRLQDLTHGDIQKVVVDRFQGMPQVNSIAVQRSDWLDNVTNEILARADGVFLWVTLAVNDQIRGLENGDSLEQLEERLESLPDEVEGIYARMLGQIEKVYRKEASIFLQIALHRDCRSLLEFVLASQDRLEDMLSSSNPLPEQELIAKSHLARQRLATTCAGLLEVHEVKSYEFPPFLSQSIPLGSEGNFLGVYRGVIQREGEARDDEISNLDRKVTIGFIHTTARDFMQDSAQGKTFLKANTPSSFYPQVSYVKALLARARLFKTDPVHVDRLMDHIRLAEDKTGVAQTGLCHLMDDVMSRIDRTCGPSPTKIHWSVHWAGDSWDSLHADLLPSDSKASFPSSSNDSFHSVNSHPDTSSDLRVTLVKKPNFLAFAVYHKLRRYVQKVLVDRTESLDADTASYLLYCAVRSLRKLSAPDSIGSADDLSVINDFLRQGGNPNLKDSDLKTSIWSAFLVAMLETFLSYHLGHSGKAVGEWEELRRAYMKTTVAFVENGADLHLTCSIPYHAALVGCYSLDLDLSALAVIEICLQGEIEHSRLRSLCTTKGAPYYSRCAQITKLNDVVGDLDQTLKLYDSESTAILKIYKKVFDDGASREKVEDEMATYIEQLFRDRIKDVTEPESLFRSRLEDLSDSDS